MESYLFALSDQAFRHQTRDDYPYRYELLPETKRILEEACRLSGKAILVWADPTLPAYASVKLAKEEEPAHHIYYRPNLRPIRDYLVACEASYIIREYAGAPKERNASSFGDDRHRISTDVGLRNPFLYSRDERRDHTAESLLRSLFLWFPE